MDLLKKHYEKIILGAVLLVLAIGAASLPVMIGNERADLDSKAAVLRGSPKPLEPLNFSTQQLAVAELRAAPGLDFSATNKVFNPVTWQKTPDGKILKITTGEETGPKALVVTKVTPLYLTISLDGVNLTEANPRYTINVQNEAATDRNKRGRKPFFTTLNSKNDLFTLREVKGPPETPDLVLEMADGTGSITLKKGEPYRRVEGYTVDMKYPLENRPPWTGLRVGSVLTFAGEAYNIVAITKTEVVVSAKLNQKKTPVPIPQ
jgi:hypothetical protein